MADDLAAALDPVVFAQRAGITPETWQAAVLRSPARHRILCCSRQAGKSTVSAVAAVHQALYHPNSLILLLAPVGRQAKELLGKVRDIYAGVRSEMGTEADNAVTLEFANGSRIVVIPDKEGNVRGFSAVDLLIIDEAAWVLDATYQAVRPMLAVSQGKVMLLSTPNGKRGFFHYEWSAGGADWHRSMITVFDVPHIDQAWIATERGKIPASNFDAEYMCVFGEMEDAVFHFPDIRDALTDDVKPLFAQEAA
jgi:hypothetical protein